MEQNKETQASVDLPVTTWEIIDAEVARKYLEKNICNRPLRPTRVQQYVRDIIEGRWPLTHQGIAFDINGNLTDGQHRLTAIVEASAVMRVALRMQVTRGLPLESKGVIDTMAIRNGGDAISFDESWRQELASACIEGSKVSGITRAMVNGINYNGFSSISNSRIVAYASKYKEAILFTAKCFPKNRERITVAPVKGVVARAYIARPNDREKIKRFAEILFTGMPKDESEEAAVTLRNWLMENPKDRECYGKAEKALLYFIEGRPMEKLYTTQVELFLLPGESSEEPEDANKLADDQGHRYFLIPVKSLGRRPAIQIVEDMLLEGCMRMPKNAPYRKQIIAKDHVCFHASGAGVVGEATISVAPKRAPRYEEDPQPYEMRMEEQAYYAAAPVLLDSRTCSQLTAFKADSVEFNPAIFVSGTRPISKQDFELLTRSSAKGKA